MLRAVCLFCLVILSPYAFSQIEENTASEQKIDKIPQYSDDQATEKLLKEMTKKAGWFPEITIEVAHGIVTIDGRANNEEQLTWLSKTADKLPTVIAVVNKAKIVTPPWTDMTPVKTEFIKLTDLLKRNIPRLLLGLILGSLLFWIGLRIQNVSRRVWSRKVGNIFLAATMARLFMMPVWLMLFYVTLMIIGLQSLAGTIIGGTGVLGIILGFAFKGIAENYLSGILLAIRSPFTQGDAVKINNVEGIVQNLNMRGTTILDWDGNLQLIPNIMVIQSIVKNMTVNNLKRASFSIGVGFRDSIRKCEELITEALKTIEGIKTEPLPLIQVETLGISTVNIHVYFWFDALECGEGSLKSAALVKVKEMLLSHGVSIPDANREVIFSEAIKVQMLENFDQLAAQDKEKIRKMKSQAAANFKAVDEMSKVEGDHQKELAKIAETTGGLPTQGSKDNFLNQ